jgi:hypothetical protein
VHTIAADVSASNFRCCWGGKEVGDSLLAVVDGARITVVSVAKGTIEKHDAVSGAPTAVAWVQDRSAGGPTKHALLAAATGNSVTFYNPLSFDAVAKAKKLIEVEEGDEIGTTCVQNAGLPTLF